MDYFYAVLVVLAVFGIYLPILQIFREKREQNVQNKELRAKLQRIVTLEADNLSRHISKDCIDDYDIKAVEKMYGLCPIDAPSIIKLEYLIRLREIIMLAKRTKAVKDKEKRKNTDDGLYL